MLLEEIPLRFKNASSRRELRYSLATPASDSEIMQAEQRLGTLFPQQVKLFYQHYNGVRIDDPPLEILAVNEITYFSSNLLHFATLDGGHHLHFDISKLNAAEQWDIVTTDGFCVTLTMASFWSNRMWAWIEKRRPIWHEERAT
ncbi:MAG TPA: SMI1/KNR4 family protein [Pyrinomonadaceae bacterium]